MKVLITGGREFTDEILLRQILDQFQSRHTINAIIHGGSQGADRLASRWAQENGIEEVVCKADWKQYGRGAGLIANKAMLEEQQPDLVIAFPGGRGTAHMVRSARAAGIEVLRAVAEEE